GAYRLVGAGGAAVRSLADPVRGRGLAVALGGSRRLLARSVDGRLGAHRAGEQLVGHRVGDGVARAAARAARALPVGAAPDLPGGPIAGYGLRAGAQLLAGAWRTAAGGLR